MTQSKDFKLIMSNFEQIGDWQLVGNGLVGLDIVSIVDNWQSLEAIPALSKVRSSRGGAKLVTLADGRELVVRKYLRGGLLGNINRSLHLRPLDWSNARPFREYFLLEKLAKQGFPAPEPVFAGLQKTMAGLYFCLLYTSPSPRDATLSRMPSSA